jgi:hypothetical protein
MARRIDEENHPEILLQVHLYGWLFQRGRVRPERIASLLRNRRNRDDPIRPWQIGFGRVGALLALKRLAAEPYEPVGRTKCLGCGFTDRCWAPAEKNGDIALVYCVDQLLRYHFHQSPHRQLEFRRQ